MFLFFPIAVSSQQIKFDCVSSAFKVTFIPGLMFIYQILCIPYESFIAKTASDWLSALTGADVWLEAGRPLTGAAGAAALTPTPGYQTPGTTCCTAPLVSYVNPGQTQPEWASATESERPIKVPLPLHFPPPDNILSPLQSFQRGISQNQPGFCAFSLLNMKI